MNKVLAFILSLLISIGIVKRPATTMVPTSTPEPTVIVNQTKVPMTTPIVTPRISIRPKPTVHPTPTPSPTPIPISDVADVYLGGQLSYSDNTNGYGRGFVKNELNKVNDPIYWVAPYIANGGGKTALNITVHVYLDGKLIK